MKVKNIIIGMLVAIGALTSCTSEEPIEPQVNNGDLSIVFSVKDTQTKAAADEHYTYATTDEITIRNCIIAVFDGDITQSEADPPCIKYYEGAIDSGDLVRVDPETSSKGEVPSYKYTLKDMKLEGVASKKISFLVIANSQNRSGATVGEGSAYSDFKNLVETTTDFESDELVKVGYAVQEVTTSDNVVKVPLTQLTARIDFGGVTLDKNFEGTGGSENTTVDEGAKAEYVVPNDKGIRDALLRHVDLTGYNNIEEQTWNPDWEEDVDETPDGYYYFYRKSRWSKNYYRVKFYKQTKVETTIKTIGDNLVVDESKTIGGINTQSALPIFSTSTIENQMYKAKSDFSITGNTFYTYENNKGKDITLTVNCGIGGSTTTTKTTYVKYSYVIQIWTRVRGALWRYSWEDAEKTNNGTYEQEGEPEISVSEGGSVANGKDYMITLDGSKIIKGHLYKVTGVCTPSLDVMPVLKWKVIDLETGNDISIEFD